MVQLQQHPRTVNISACAVILPTEIAILLLLRKEAHITPSQDPGPEVKSKGMQATGLWRYPGDVWDEVLPATRQEDGLF